MAFSDPTDEEDEEPLPRRLVFGDMKPWKICFSPTKLFPDHDA
jgi:hypothetical protein